MSLTALTTEPEAIYAGDTINWLISLADYPANAGWTLKYTAVCAAGQFAITSIASGSDHSVSVAKATTAGYPAGTYTLTKYVESSTERVTLAELTFTILPNLAGKSAAFDNRTHVKKVLDAIEAVLEARASKDQLQYTIGGRSLQRTPVEDLLKLRSTYYNYYQQEQAAAKLAQGTGAGTGKIRVRL